MNRLLRLNLNNIKFITRFHLLNNTNNGIKSNMIVRSNFPVLQISDPQIYQINKESVQILNTQNDIKNLENNVVDNNQKVKKPKIKSKKNKELENDFMNFTRQNNFLNKKLITFIDICCQSTKVISKFF
jgi:hypothetical protein